MKFILLICFLLFIFLQGCHQTSPSSMNEDSFKNYVNVNASANSNLSPHPDAAVKSSTSVAQPGPQQPVTLVNVAF